MTQTVFITGCSSGIGLASAKLFNNHGWNVVATMRRPESEAGVELSKLPNTLVTRLDLLDVESIQTAVQTAITRFGSIDVLINNAGYGQYGLLEAVSREQIQEQFETNVFGLIDTIKTVLPHMRSNKPTNGRRGVILNVGSGGGKFALPLLSMYTASKHALDGLTESISYELASQDISTKLVIPHSGVGKTSFHDRSNSSFAADPTLESYGSFIETVFARFGGMMSDISLTSEKVAEVVYTAVTDQTDQLRYYVGEDPLEIMQKKQTMPEEEFTRCIRTTFM